jgi:hypothetical protein
MKNNLRLALFVLLALSLSGCNLPQNGSTTVRTPVRQASPSTLPPAAATEAPVTTLAPGSTDAAPAAAATLAPTALPPAQTATAKAYPASPVAVVQAFVEAYPDQTAEMVRYLSAAVRAALPKGGPGELLKLQGDINGFTVLSGSAVPNPPQAVVVAAFDAGGARSERTFDLIQEKGLWVINGIRN